MDKLKKKRIIKRCIAIIIGMLIGFAYYWFIGCNTGTCIISGNPYISSIYGGVLSFLIYSLFEKKPEVDECHT